MSEGTVPAAEPEIAEEAGDLGLTVAVDAFSGPLDLLLYLVRKTELDVAEIPIGEIADQFTATVRGWQERGELDLEVAGDFILMAATLLEIKARTIAPPPEGDEEADQEDELFDPRADLIAKLLSYRRFKEACQVLLGLEAARAQRAVRRLKEDIPEDPEEAEGLDLGELHAGQLFTAWQGVLARIGGLGPRTVMKDDIPLEGAVSSLIERGRVEREITLGRLLAAERTLLGRVTTVMATLEVVRQRWLQAQQHEAFGEVMLRFRDEAERNAVPVLPEPEPEDGRRRRRRPPLATFSAPSQGELGADEVGKEEQASEEVYETDEQRFLRELNEACDLDQVLARAADWEAEFRQHWEVLHPPPPPPPAPEPPPAAAVEVVPAVADPVTEERPKRPQPPWLRRKPDGAAAAVVIQDTAVGGPEPVAAVVPEPAAEPPPPGSALLVPEPEVTAAPEPAAEQLPPGSAPLVPEPEVTATPEPAAEPPPPVSAPLVPEPEVTAAPELVAEPPPLVPALSKPEAAVVPEPVAVPPPPVPAMPESEAAVDPEPAPAPVAVTESPDPEPSMAPVVKAAPSSRVGPGAVPAVVSEPEPVDPVPAAAVWSSVPEPAVLVSAGAEVPVPVASALQVDAAGDEPEDGRSGGDPGPRGWRWLWLLLGLAAAILALVRILRPVPSADQPFHPEVVVPLIRPMLAPPPLPLRAELTVMLPPVPLAAQAHPQAVAERLLASVGLLPADAFCPYRPPLAVSAFAGGVRPAQWRVAGLAPPGPLPFAVRECGVSAVPSEAFLPFPLQAGSMAAWTQPAQLPPVLAFAREDAWILLGPSER